MRQRMPLEVCSDGGETEDGEQLGNMEKQNGGIRGAGEGRPGRRRRREERSREEREKSVKGARRKRAMRAPRARMEIIGSNR